MKLLNHWTAALAIVSAAGIGLALSRADSLYAPPTPDPQVSGTVSDIDFKNPGLQQCVTDAVAQIFPGAKGGFVAANDRAEGYKGFGDMLHYRERGLQTVHSVSVEADPGDGKALDVMVATRTGPVVLPSSITPEFLLNMLEDQHWTFSDNLPRADAAPSHQPHDPLLEQQEMLARNILKCRPGS